VSTGPGTGVAVGCAGTAFAVGWGGTGVGVEEVTILDKPHPVPRNTSKIAAPNNVQCADLDLSFIYTPTASPKLCYRLAWTSLKNDRARIFEEGDWPISS
jgi:hypothetical protein